ncbi:MAG: Rpn family recombination-promoting nuclease/putative transposase [Lachnospiraceae bacterium]|nr:Rpn family recombination-promoting nuclease/putative transposase [Lachnospiraceae bacterium]
MSKKKFEELDLMDNFLVLALASDLEGGPAYGRLLAEGLLHEKVAHVRVHAEKIIPGSDEIRRGIRMDVEMQSFSHKPEENELPDKVYDFEPHHKNADNLFKRSRFNQAKIDAHNLYSGERDFNKLPDLCVINILDYDPFGKGQTKYHFHNMCEEDTTISYPDGLDFYYFITTTPDDEDSELDALLKYIANSREENATTDLTKQLHKYVTKVKTSPEERYRYMTWGEYIDFETMEAKAEARKEGHAEGKEQGLAEGRAEGRAEGKCEAMREVIIEVLSELGTIPDSITQKINSSTDMEELKKWHKAAISVDSIPAFESMM